MKGKNFYQPLIDEIRKVGFPHNFKKNNKLLKQSLNYHLLKLKNKGILIKIEEGSYKVNEEKAVKFLKGESAALTQCQVPKSKKKKRGHGFRFYLPIPPILKWDQREKLLVKKDIKFKFVSSNNSHVIKVKNPVTGVFHKVQLYSQSINVFWKDTVWLEGLRDSIFSVDALQGLDEAIHQFHLIINELSKLLNYDFRLNSTYYKWSVSRQHWSLVNQAFAKWVLDKNWNIRVYGQDGRCWLTFDRSHNKHEIELQHPVDAPVQANKLDDALNDWEQQDFVKFSDMTRAIDNLRVIVKDTVENFAYHAEHEVSHVKLITRIDKGIERLTNVVEKIEKKNVGGGFPDQVWKTNVSPNPGIECPYGCPPGTPVYKKEKRKSGRRYECKACRGRFTVKRIVEWEAS